MPSIPRILLALLACGTALGAGPTQALRPPRMKGAAPASELAAPASVQVTRAWLTMSCGASACRVSARYLLASEREQGVSLSFVLPGRVSVIATLDGEPLQYKVLGDTPHSELEQTHYFTPEDGSAPLQRAYVWAPLRTGPHTLEVRYWQKLAAHEVDWGAFHDGEMVSYVRRLVAPLRGSTLAEDFVLELDVSYDRGHAPSRWQRWFGKVQSLGCSDPFRSFIAMSSEEERVARVSVRLGKAQLPDELTCRIGPTEYVDPRASSFIPW